MVVRRRRNKYGNVRTVVDGRTFDSRREAARYEELRQLEAEGLISNLRLQVTYQFILNGIKISSYRADFVYENSYGKNTVEDVKSVRTAKISTYRIKKKMMKAFHGIDVQEVF